MKKLKTFWIFIVALLSTCITLSAKNYYLSSSSGVDSNDGLSTATPWKTIDKLNASKDIFKPGDSILFKRDDTFVGEVDFTKSGTLASPIVIGAYGAGAKPVISAGSLLRGWSVYSGNKYILTSINTIKQLYLDQTPMVLARYPNTGWLFTNTPNGANGFVDTDLTQPNNYWNNSVIHIRTVNWVYEIRTVASYINKQVTFDKAADYSLRTNMGYFFDNLFSELDAEKEWFYNPNEKKLYFIPPSGTNPETSNLYGTIYDYGIKTPYDVSYVEVRDLCFKMQAKAGVWFGGTSKNIKIVNNEFYNCFTGIEMNGNPITGALIDNNKVSGSINRGIFFFTAIQSVISNNNIKNIGLLPGYGNSGVNGAIGICMTGYSDGSSVNNNTVDGSGYIGIRCDGQNCTVTQNIIKNSMQTLADGGAIYSWGTISKNNSITNNYIENVKGNNESCPDLAALPNGIYLDDGSSYMKIIGNTVINANGTGILVHNSPYSQVENNTVFNSEGVTYTEDNANINIGFSSKNNVYYALNENQIPFSIKSASGTPNFGIHQNNYYCNPYNPNVVSYRNSKYKTFYYGLNHWKTVTGQDNGTKESLIRINRFLVSDTVGSDKVSNGTFNKNVDGWQKWTTNNSIQWTTNALLDSGCLQYTAASTDINTVGRIYEPFFSLEQNKYYLVNFEIVGTKHASLFMISIGLSDGYSCYFPIEAGVRRNFMRVFKTSVSGSQVRFDFEVSGEASSYYIDNVHVYEVNGAFIDPSKKSLIFSNPSNTPLKYDLKDAILYDLDGNEVKGSFELQPWQSKILINMENNFEVVIETSELDNIVLSPCPIEQGKTATLKYKLDNFQNPVLSIFKLDGKLLFRKTDKLESPIEINTSGLHRGLYFVRLQSGNINIVKKLLVL